ncbi:hypothetical protein ACFL2X_00110 [Candidatus Latescibacterota bacterium]
MEETSYNLIFRGVIADGHDAETVRKNIAELFKVSEEKVERLFSGRPVTVKKNVDKATALKYQSAFKKAGALCSVEPFSVAADKKSSAEEKPPGTSPDQKVPDAAEGSAAAEFSIPPGLKVILPERTKRELRFSPQQSPSVSSSGNDLNFNRADMKTIPIEKIELVSVFSEELNDEIIYRIVFFLNGMKRPLLLNVDTIRYNQFPGVRNDTTMKSLANFILYLLCKNPNIIIDRHTEEFLHGNQQNLIVIEPLDFITAIGKSIEE